MKRKFLEDLGLEKGAIDEIMEANGVDIENTKSASKTLETKVATLESENKGLKSQMTERDSQLESLKNSTGDVEALKAQITTLQTENTAKDEAHTAEIKQLKIDSAVSAALIGAKAKNVKAVQALIDLKDSELLEDGTIKGLDDQIKKLQGAEDSKFLFDTETKKTRIKGANPGEPGKENLDDAVDISKMSYNELCAYMAENPDASLE